jgi:hypothetical protein
VAAKNIDVQLQNQSKQHRSRACEAGSSIRCAYPSSLPAADSTRDSKASGRSLIVKLGELSTSIACIMRLVRIRGLVARLWQPVTISLAAQSNKQGVLSALELWLACTAVHPPSRVPQQAQHRSCCDEGTTSAHQQERNPGSQQEAVLSVDGSIKYAPCCELKYSKSNCQAVETVHFMFCLPKCTYWASISHISQSALTRLR